VSCDNPKVQPAIKFLNLSQYDFSVEFSSLFRSDFTCTKISQNGVLCNIFVINYFFKRILFCNILAVRDVIFILLWDSLQNYVFGIVYKTTLKLRPFTTTIYKACFGRSVMVVVPFTIFSASMICPVTVYTFNVLEPLMVVASTIKFP